MSFNPLEELLLYLRDCSETSTQAVALKQLEIASILRKDIRKDFDRLIEALVRAEIASLLLSGKIELPRPQVAEKKDNAA